MRPGTGQDASTKKGIAAAAVSRAGAAQLRGGVPATRQHRRWAMLDGKVVDDWSTARQLEERNWSALVATARRHATEPPWLLFRPAGAGVLRPHPIRTTAAPSATAPQRARIKASRQLPSARTPTPVQRSGPSR